MPAHNKPWHAGSRTHRKVGRLRSLADHDFTFSTVDGIAGTVDKAVATVRCRQWSVIIATVHTVGGTVVGVEVASQTVVTANWAM